LYLFLFKLGKAMSPKRTKNTGNTPPPPDAALYDQILASLQSGVIAVDANGTILTANPAAAAILGFAPEALRRGQHVQHLKDLPHFAEMLRELTITRDPIQRRELELERADGRRLLGISASPLHAEKDQPFQGAIFLFTDLSEIKNLERKAELNRQLAQIGELTAGVVHEIRNPMSVISGMAELLIRRLGPENTATPLAETIMQEAGQIEKLVAQFLSFARPFECTLRRCAAEDILARAVQLCERLAREKEVRLETTPPLASPSFQADPPKLGQALGNLLRNAIEVAPRGGWVRIGVSHHSGLMIFAIEDNGPGIHTEPGEDIFNPFFSKKEGGTGLGLSIVHRIVTAHGGSITYHNRAAGGACFEVSLPIEFTPGKP